MASLKDIARWASKSAGQQRRPVETPQPFTPATHYIPQPVPPPPVAPVNPVYRQPQQAVPYGYPQQQQPQSPQQHAQQFGRPVPQQIGTCTLVKKGSAPAGHSADPYADLLAGLPELVPDGPGLGYDAMAGNMSPLSAAEVGNIAAAISAESGQPLLMDEPPIAHPSRGIGVPSQHVADLASAAGGGNAA